MKYSGFRRDVKRHVLNFRATSGHNLLYMRNDVSKEMSRFRLPSSGRWRLLLKVPINKVPSAVGLRLLPDPGLNEATEAIEEITEQTNATDPPLISDNPSLQEQPIHLGCTSPFRNHPLSVHEIKQKA